MSRKKQKTLQGTAVQTEEAPERDLISTLPWELIAEILSRTTSKEVLAMARCNRHFCHSLVTVPRSKTIWEKARKNCNLPEPTPNFTEPSYAAFVFDGGPCSQCRKLTKNLYTSFSLRLRFCKAKCAKKWINTSSKTPDETEDTKAVAQWLLCSEIEFREDPYNELALLLGVKYVQQAPFYHASEFDKAVEDYKGFISLEDSGPQDRRQLYTLLYEKHTRKKQETMNLCSCLVSWKSNRTQEVLSVQIENWAILIKLADEEGWEVNDFLNTPTCKSLLRNYNCALHHIRIQGMSLNYEIVLQSSLTLTMQLLDLNLIRTDVGSEVTKIVRQRNCSEEGKAYAKRQALIALDYHRRKSANSVSSNPVALPTLNVFRELAIIKAIQNKQGSKPKDVIKKFGDDAVKQLIEEALSTWRNQTTKTFMNILGMKSYCAISTKKLHPVDRLTARFLCTKCLEHTPDKRKVSPLDFKTACSHQCSHLTKKQKGKAKWSPEQFELDHQAANVTRKLLALLDVSEDDKSSSTAVAKIKDRILCKTCDGQITMNFHVLQRHSHRHDNMEIEILSSTQAKELAFLPIQWGLCSGLTSRAKSAPRKAELRKYGCRHCVLYEAAGESKPTIIQSEAINETEVYSKLPSTRSKQRKLMTFNGMRCHLLQAHGVSVVDDEDVYCADDMQ